ncbi:TetR family transcriptional regulator, partial [Streptomyces brasiliscabiei]
LAIIVEAIALHMAYHRDLAFLDAERRALTPENFDRYIASRDSVERPLRLIVERGVQLGRFATPYPAEAARAILTMCQGIAGWYHPDG